MIFFKTVISILIVNLWSIHGYKQLNPIANYQTELWLSQKRMTSIQWTNKHRSTKQRTNHISKLHATNTSTKTNTEFQNNHLTSTRALLKKITINNHNPHTHPKNRTELKKFSPCPNKSAIFTKKQPKTNQCEPKESKHHHTSGNRGTATPTRSVQNTERSKPSDLSVLWRTGAPGTRRTTAAGRKGVGGKRSRVFIFRRSNESRNTKREKIPKVCVNEIRERGMRGG